MCPPTGEWLQHTDALYSRAWRAHAVFIRKRLITNTVGERNVIFFYMPVYKKEKDKKRTMKIRYIGVRCVGTDSTVASRFVFIDFSSDIIARWVNAIFIPSRSVHQRDNPKITCFNFDRLSLQDPANDD